ncbi:hypothetical protein PGB90_004598 [Kerria lacca]
MLKYTIFAIFLLIAFRGSNGDIFADLLNPNAEIQTNVDNTTPDADGTLPSTGYWNYLLVFGLWGRVFQFFTTNARGFGTEIKKLDAEFKREFGTNEYVNLERDVVHSISIIDFIIDSKNLLERIRSVSVPGSEETLGDAIDILTKLASDKNVIDTFVREWRMQKNLDTIFKDYPQADFTEDQIRNTKKLLLQNPNAFLLLLTDPAVINSIAGYLLKTVNTAHIIHGIDSIDMVTDSMQQLYPDKYEFALDVLSNLKDDQTGLSLLDSLQTIYNIIKSPEFKTMIELVLDISQMNGNQNFNAGPTSFDANDQFSPEFIQANLQSVGIFMSQDEAKFLLNASKSGTLSKIIDDFIDTVDALEGGFTVANINSVLTEKNINIDVPTISYVVNILGEIDSETTTEFLKSIGISIDQDIIIKAQQKCVTAIGNGTLNDNSQINENSSFKFDDSHSF